jgi:hypothetical protein
VPGWELADRSTARRPGLACPRACASLDVAIARVHGSPEGLLAAYVENILEPGAEQFRACPRPVEGVVLDSGQVGARIAYVGLFGDVQAPIEGRGDGRRDGGRSRRDLRRLGAERAAASSRSTTSAR